MSNGYIQIDFKGQSTGLKFGMLAVKEIVVDSTNHKQRGGSVTVLKGLYDMVYWGLINNYELKRKDIDFTNEEVIDWVDEHNRSKEGKELLNSIADCFLKSRAWEDVQTEINEAAIVEKKKKNSVGKK